MPVPYPISAEEAISMIEAVQVRPWIPEDITYDYSFRNAASAIHNVDNNLYENCTFYKYEETPEFKEIISKAENFLYDRKSGLIILNMGCKHQMLSSVLYWLYNPKGAKMKQGDWDLDDCDAYYESGFGFYRSSCSQFLHSGGGFPIVAPRKIYV